MYQSEKCSGDEIEIVLTGASLEESNGKVAIEHRFQMKILHVTMMMALLLILTKRFLKC